MAQDSDYIFSFACIYFYGFPTGLVGKESAFSAGDTGNTGSIPGLRKSSVGGNGNSLQYSCLKNPMVRGAWPATVQKVAQESGHSTVQLLFMDFPGCSVLNN